MNKDYLLKKVTGYSWLSRILLTVGYCLFATFRLMDGIRGFVPGIMILPLILFGIAIYLNCRALILNAALPPAEKKQRADKFWMWFGLLAAFILLVLTVFYLF